MKCRDCMNYDVCSTESVNCDRANHCSMFKDKSQYIKLPCKVGDTVYGMMPSLISDCKKKKILDEIIPYTVGAFIVGKPNEDVLIMAEQGMSGKYPFKIDIPASCINETVFLTKEAADKALGGYHERKQKIYDELSRVLTDYENGDAEKNDLYEMLVKIQDNWECVITAEE